MFDLFPEAAAQAPAVKVISLWQPWASLAAYVIKIDETRHWKTAHRGPLAIHAAKRMDLAGAPEALCHAVFGPWWADELPRGAVVAMSRLAACRPAERVADTISRANLAAGNFTVGRFAWRLEDTRPLVRPIPLVGRQGLFNWEPPADLETLLGPRIDHLAACRRIGWA